MRRGRKRKLGKRKRSGDLILPRGPTPAQIAATMPHRKGLGEKAADQRGENELGRMVLRGELDEAHGTAGEQYRRIWQGYLAAISAPRALRKPAGAFNRCEGCPGTSEAKKCMCELRRAKWTEIREILAETGCTHYVDAVCLQDCRVAREQHWLLKTGLWAVAQHLGIVKRGQLGVVGNRPSKSLEPQRPRGS